VHGTTHVLVRDDEAKVQIIGATILSANYMYTHIRIIHQGAGILKLFMSKPAQRLNAD